jgi:hypothetical protein
MDKNLISLECGRIILNVNAIAMVFPDEDMPDDVTCINTVDGRKTFYIRENFESVKEKLSDWMVEDV